MYRAERPLAANARVEGALLVVKAETALPPRCLFCGRGGDRRPRRFSRGAKSAQLVCVFCKKCREQAAYVDGMRRVLVTGLVVAALPITCAFVWGYQLVGLAIAAPALVVEIIAWWALVRARSLEVARIHGDRAVALRNVHPEVARAAVEELKLVVE